MSTAAVNVVSGINGSGKTLYALQLVEKMRRESVGPEWPEGRPVYYWGIPGVQAQGKLPHWKIIEEFEDDWPRSEMKNPGAVHDLPNGSIIVIDEAHRPFGRSNGRETPKHIEPFAMARHLGHTFVLLTQSPGDLHQFVRTRIGQHWHLIRVFGLERATVWNWQEYGDPKSTKSEAKAIKEEFQYPKEVYTWYKSSDSHQIKKKFPWKKLWPIPFAIVVVPLAIWFVINRLHPQPKIDPAAQAAIAPKPIAEKLSPKQQQEKEGKLFAVKFSERVPGLPYSAPLYDDELKAKTMPKISGCLNIQSPKLTRCTCQTQQGTTITTISYDQCVFYTKNGWFDPTKPDEKFERSAGAGGPHAEESGTAPGASTPVAAGASAEAPLGRLGG